MRDTKETMINHGANAFLKGIFRDTCNFSGWRLKYWRIGWDKAHNGEITK